MQWRQRNEQSPSPPEGLSAWAERLEISEHLALLLWRRGFQDYEGARLFLNPRLRTLAGLDQWPGLEEAATVLAEGLLAGKRLCVWGDYDADGITATALVKENVSLLGFSCDHYIPNRLTEGYGLNIPALDHLAAEGADLLLTVDSGISDMAAVTHARNLGMTVIVTDHHLPGSVLPPANAIVNPRLAPCPCPALAGVGVAFLLMAALNAVLHKAGRPKPDIRELLDLVALGTLADVVELSGQNRVLVKNGLLKIGEGARPGIAALKSAAGLSPRAVLGAGQVAFTLAPRINAAGRLGSCETAVELMLTRDRDRAQVLAEELSRLNAERRDEEDRICLEAMKQAEKQAAQGVMGLVLHSPDWHPGIIGIVASRVVESLRRPTVVLCSANGHMKGSGRSVSGFDLHEAFCACSELFLGFGGHRMAAGLSLSPDQLPSFMQRFDELARARIGETPAEQSCFIDAELPFSLASDFTFLKELEQLQPFGVGNAEPVFSSLPLRVRNMRGKPGLMLLDLTEETSRITLKAKAWRDLAAMPESLKNSCIRIAYTPRIDRYNGVASVELRLRDWKKVVE